MPTTVTDPRSSPRDQIAHAAEVIGRSKDKRAVFEAVYRGRKQKKTASELVSSTRIARQQVLNAAKQLVNNHIINQEAKGREPVYVKDPFYAANRDKVLSLASSPDKLKNYPTRSQPRISVPPIQIVLPRKLVKVDQVTIDEIDSFAAANNQPFTSGSRMAPPRESWIKKGFQCILGDSGLFRDWGGERNDLWTTRLRFRGRRKPTAIAFKGKGTRGKLTPKKMGRNGDQIQRLFKSAADVFLCQYWGQIDESVVELMRSLATAKSVLETKRVTFGIIDGDDTKRLIDAYPKCFPAEPLTGRSAKKARR